MEAKTPSETLSSTLGLIPPKSTSLHLAARASHVGVVEVSLFFSNGL